VKEKEMPDFKTHQYAGIAAGVVYSAYDAKEQELLAVLLEAVGGAVGGSLGGVLPDYLEPAISSWHRGTGHSWTAGAAIVSGRALLSEWAAFCRAKADQNHVLRATPQIDSSPVDPITRLCWAVAEFLWRFLAGFLNGLAAGYVSHLVLDVATPRSIPLMA
jgi:hypothetical protein